jgi:preprotein translocase subunit SecY
LPVRFSKNELGAEQSSYLSLKLNSAGLIPIALASWLLFVFGLLLSFSSEAGWPATIGQQIQSGRPAYLVLFGILMVFCAFFYTALVLDPEEISERLNKLGGKVATVEPGEPTVENVDHVLSRTAAIGVAYRALVYLLPEVLVLAGVPFSFNGVALLVLVCTSLDLEKHFRLRAQMKEVIRTSDANLALIGGALLDSAKIDHTVLDQNMSVLEGSLSVLPRRVVVAEEHADRAGRLLREAGLGHELVPHRGEKSAGSGSAN